MKETERPFWKENIVYQIYPRSFQDSNGDGIGDIPGIIARLDEIAALGVGIIWLSPVYPSPDADNGYDISDYKAIHPRFGTMADMERLIEEAGRRGIKIIMDLVINHTSDEHEWFKQSRNPASPYRDYYIWRPGRTGDPAKAGTKEDKPNNWSGFFMNEVWEWDEQSGEYYLHLFDKKQPDLNWKNPKVMEEVKDILRFWLDKGIAGFRCDVINIIYKTSLDDGKKSLAVTGIEHYKSQEGAHAILRELRRDVLDNYGCFTVGETVMVDLPEAKDLCDEARRELDMLFYFEHLEVDRVLARFIPKKFRAEKLLAVLAKWQRGLEWNAVYLENHDQTRIVSHYGDDRAYWKTSAKMLCLMQMTLRGTAFVYQGQEIGMTNFDFTRLEQLNDVESRNLDALMRKKLHIPRFLRWKWVKESSRDNARTPVQWNAAKNAGFTTGTPWLPVNGNYTRINYAAQKDDPGSVLSFYRMMIKLRLASDTLKYGDFEPLLPNISRVSGDVQSEGKRSFPLSPPDGAGWPKNVIAYRRSLGDECYTVWLNFSGKTVTLPQAAAMPSVGAAIAASSTGKTVWDGKLAPWEGLLVRG